MHIMEKELAKSGWIMFAAVELNTDLKIALTQHGEIMTVTIMKTMVCHVQVSYNIHTAIYFGLDCKIKI